MKNRNSALSRKSTRTSVRVLCMMATLLMVFSALSVAIIPASAANSSSYDKDRHLLKLHYDNYSIRDLRKSQTYGAVLDFSFKKGLLNSYKATCTVNFGSNITAVNGQTLVLEVKLSNGSVVTKTALINSTYSGKTAYTVSLDKSIGFKYVTSVSCYLTK